MATAVTKRTTCTGVEAVAARVVAGAAAGVVVKGEVPEGPAAVGAVLWGTTTLEDGPAAGAGAAAVDGFTTPTPAIRTAIPAAVGKLPKMHHRAVVAACRNRRRPTWLHPLPDRQQRRKVELQRPTLPRTHHQHLHPAPMRAPPQRRHRIPLIHHRTLTSLIETKIAFVAGVFGLRAPVGLHLFCTRVWCTTTLIRRRRTGKPTNARNSHLPAEQGHDCSLSSCSAGS